MNKLLILGDIHGKTIWKNIIEKEEYDKVIFLGDYVSTHDDITEEDQIINFEEILNFKESNPDKVILLRGNHDLQFLGYYWAECSGYFPNVAQYCQEFKDRILQNTQYIYIEDNIIFSHAGISQVWLDNECNFDPNFTLNNLNNIEPRESFGFIPDSPFDYYGDSITQSCVWIRPKALAKCNIIGYTQVVGHTPVTEIIDIYKTTKGHEHIWLCDCLNKEYLTIDNGTFTKHSII